MDRETIDLYTRYEGLNDADIQQMSIQELFDLRHDMLDLMNKLGGLLKKIKTRMMIHSGWYDLDS